MFGHLRVGKALCLIAIALRAVPVSWTDLRTRVCGGSSGRGSSAGAGGSDLFILEFARQRM